MRIEQGKIESDCEISDEFELRGMIVGNVTVINGGVFYLHGMVTKNLDVVEGGRVYLRGTVSGNVTNRGGDLEIYGVVIGWLNKLSGNTFVDSNAKIGGAT